MSELGYELQKDVLAERTAHAEVQGQNQLAVFQGRGWLSGEVRTGVCG